MRKYEPDSLFGPPLKQDADSGHIVRVAFDSGADTEFDYLVADELWPVSVGQRVEAPFGRGNKHQVGFCVREDVPLEKSFAAKAGNKKLKRIAKIIDNEPLINNELMQLAQWISDYYICPLGQVLGAMVPSAVKKNAGVRKKNYVYLAGKDSDFLKNIRGSKQKQVIRILQMGSAFGPERAVELQVVLLSADCTKAPLKKLIEKEIVKVFQKKTLKSLPAIPKGLSLKGEKVVLNEDQQKALAHFRARLAEGSFGVTLLHGVTDSGKTELYIRAVELVLQKGKTAIVLLPEIALTAQTVQRFSSRFERICIMHSGLNAAQRNDQWQKIKIGKADVVIGARSAVFAPLPNVGLIVVDEEHEPSYKQQTLPRYHGRDVAIKRAQMSEAHCILGSATPSLESLFNCRRREHFDLIRLPKRVMNLPAPEMKIVDMKDKGFRDGGITLISEPLADHLKEVLARSEQAILFLNRRGYSNLIFCPSCKYTLHCRNCDVTLTFHKSQQINSSKMQTLIGRHMKYGYAICHYCLAKTLVPRKCPLCGKAMTMIGLGSQRLEEELVKKFPQARVARVDSDSMAGADYYRVLEDFSRGRIDILAGTQMLAKGLHFPNVTLVGVISADTSLYLPDFRANERTFQLISQVAGRAGRSAKKGTVYVQTLLANQPAIQFALANDSEGFVKEELKHRQACNLPPFWRLAIITLRDEHFDRLQVACGQMRERIERIVESNSLKVIVRGPMPAVISRIQRFHRMQIVLQAPQAAIIARLFKKLRAARPIRPAVYVAIDVDPVNLL